MPILCCPDAVSNPVLIWIVCKWMLTGKCPNQLCHGGGLCVLVNPNWIHCLASHLSDERINEAPNQSSKMVPACETNNFLFFFPSAFLLCMFFNFLWQLMKTSLFQITRLFDIIISFACVLIYFKQFFFFVHIVITPPRNRGGVIFSLQFVCVSVCLCVRHFLLTKFQPNGCTNLDAVFAKWLLPALAQTIY